MKHHAISLFLLFTGVLSGQGLPRSINNGQTLWFDAPAKSWHAALPLGNGRLGALVHGNVHAEVINLNEETLVAGQSYYKEMPQMLPSLNKIKQLWFEGRYIEAEELAQQTMCIANDDRYGHYKPLGDLVISFEGIPGDVHNYSRELSLDSGVSTISFTAGSAKHTRTGFISYPDQVMVFSFASDKAAGLNANISFLREENARISMSGNDALIVRGQCTFGGTKFNAIITVTTKTGKIFTQSNNISIRSADSFEIRVVCKTDYWQENNYADLCDQLAKTIAVKSNDELLNSHLADYHKNFSRVALSLPKTQFSALPLSARLNRIIADPKNLDSDLDLVALYFQYGRYLLFSSSRPGCLPANLRGIWNPEYLPGWFSDYTLNINFEMNYWLSESCNLSECAQPLFSFLEKSIPVGRKAAKDRYGAHGFVLGTRTTAHVTSEMRSGNFGWFQDGHAWVAQAFWQHYLYTLDKTFLRNRAYPILKEIAAFYLDFLTPHPKYGWLVAGPSASPENAYIVPGYENQATSIFDAQNPTIFNTGSRSKTASLGMGNTISNQIIRDIFSQCIEASTLLGVDEEFRNELQQKRHKLPPTRIGKDGTIMEWLEDFQEADPSHRHISHLYGLAPSNQITKELTPDIAQAAYKTLEKRLRDGNPRPSWSWGWITNCWARLEDGDKALNAVANSLATATFENLMSKEHANGKDEFIIDGILGATAGIAEMLLQSHAGRIDLLPALPTAFSDGKIQGLKAQGGFILDIEWKHGELTKVTVFSEQGSLCKLRYRERTAEFPTHLGQTYILYSDL